MGRSQRHMLWEQGSTAAGEIHAEGVVAPGIAMQVNPEALNVLKPGPPLYNTGLELKKPHPEPHETVEVPIGEPGGPLTGSSLTGAIPEELEAPPEPPEEAEFRIVGFNPEPMVAGYPDLSVEVIGQGFENSAVVVFGGTDMSTEFVSEARLRFLCPSSTAVVGIVPVTVKQGSHETASANFNFIEDGGQPLAAKEETEAESDRDAGPFNIVLIEDHMEGLAVTLESGEFKAGDDVSIEATNNSNVNGDFEILEVEGLVIVIDNNFELLSPIENKGRLTITGAVV